MLAFAVTIMAHLLLLLSSAAAAPHALRDSSKRASSPQHRRDLKYG
jgi:hypothetical protein